MKNHLLFLFAASLLFLSAVPQTSSAQSSSEDDNRHTIKMLFGIKGGLNIANLTIDNNSSMNDKHAIASFNGGVYVDVPLLPVLSVQTGLFVNGKGAKFTLGDAESNNYTRVSAKPIYLELPVTMLVKVPLFNKVKLFFGAGPYMAMGVAGKNKVDGKLVSIPFSDNSNITYGNDGLNGNNGNSYEGNFKRFDAGFNIVGGIEISHFTLNANYGYGVVNVKPGTTNGVDNKYQNRVVSVQVGAIL